MRERVLAIVTMLAQYFLDGQDATSEHELVEELLAIGFAADEIDAAFNWMETQSFGCAPPQELSAPVTSHRVFSPEEQRYLAGDARGFLVRLRSSGILDSELFEEIVDKAVEMADEELSLKEVRTIAVLALFARSQQQWRQEFDHLLEDDWYRLLN